MSQQDATLDDIRKMKPEELRAYVAEVAPIHNTLYNQAEELMVQARPLNEGLFTARNRLIDMGEPL